MAMTHPLGPRHGLSVPRYSFATETAGLLIILVGAWAGIVSFVGPTFGFSADGAGSWYWSLSHTLLFLIPGAAALFGGVLVMLGTRPLRMFGAMLATLAGAWLVVGVVAWPVFEGSTFFAAASASAVRTFEYWIGYSLGPGCLLIGLGAFTLGRTILPRVREVPQTGFVDRDTDVGSPEEERPVADRRMAS